MKIALCYSGMVRSLFHCVDSHKKFLFEKYDCDVFFHLWDIEGYKNNQRVNEDETSLTEETRNKIVDKLNPVSFRFENIKQYTEEHLAIVSKFKETMYGFLSNQHGVNGKNVVGMYHSIQKSFQLMKSSQKEYDIVIRLRTDLQLKQEVNITNILPNHVYMPTISRYPIGYNDQFGYGDTKSMEVYANVYQTLLLENENNFTIHPEIALGMQLSRNNIIVESNSSIIYDIIPNWSCSSIG